MKNVLVMGATSGIGKCTVAVGLAKGYRIRAFARGADALAPQEGLEAIAGDALVAANVGEVLEGVDAVIYALGIKESVAMLWQTVTLFSRSTEVLLSEMNKTGVKRLIAVTGFGAGRSRQAMSKVEQIGHRALLGRPYADKDVQEQMIIDSDTDWTIARPVILTNNQDKVSYRVLRDPDTWRNGLVARKAVADYLINAVDDPQDIGKDLVLLR